MENENKKSATISIFPIYIGLILLKAFGYVTMGWVWVLTFPIWVSIIMWLVVVGSVFLLGVLAVLIGKR